MHSGNYCKKCGHRILPNEVFCTGCGRRTGNDASDKENIFVHPIHNIGFFNFDIDFSPYIVNDKREYNYEICHCGYLNHVDNEFCYMCGAKRTQSKLSRILKNKSKPQFSVDNVLCECGAVNSRENIFCEMCGRQLKESPAPHQDNYSNFNLEYADSIFCFCGEENEKFSQFCNNCGLPLSNYGHMSDISILCTCSKINEITADFCIDCGTSLEKENTEIVCRCGHRNPQTAKFCHNCDRPLNPQRCIKSRIICSCGQILDWDADYCHNCGKNVRKSIVRRNSINYTIKNLKSVFR